MQNIHNTRTTMLTACTVQERAQWHAGCAMRPTRCGKLRSLRRQMNVSLSLVESHCRTKTAGIRYLPNATTHKAYPGYINNLTWHGKNVLTLLWKRGKILTYYCLGISWLITISELHNVLKKDVLCELQNTKTSWYSIINIMLVKKNSHHVIDKRT